MGRRLAGPATIQVPDDLAAALAAEPTTEAMFATLNGQNRYAVLHRATTALRPGPGRGGSPRTSRCLARGETAYPQKQAEG